MHATTHSLFWLAVVSMIAPLSTAETAFVADAVHPEIAPQGAQDGTVYCTGTAPFPQPRCDAWFNAYSSLTITSGGTFTGELRCRLNGPLYSWREYRMEVVAGFIVTYAVSGPGLYAGYIHMHCEATGLYGAGGQYAGVGTISLRVDYA